MLFRNWRPFNLKLSAYVKENTCCNKHLLSTLFILSQRLCKSYARKWVDNMLMIFIFALWRSAWRNTSHHWATWHDWLQEFCLMNVMLMMLQHVARKIYFTCAGDSLVLAHPGCPGQNPQSRETVVCVCVCVCKCVCRWVKGRDTTPITPALQRQ